MPEKSIRWRRPLLAVIVLIGVSLSCKERDKIDEYSEDFWSGATEEDRVEFFENLEAEGERPYTVDVYAQNYLDQTGWPARIRDDCDPGYGQGGNMPASIVFTQGEYLHEETVTITDANGARQYHRRASDSRFMFCRKITMDKFTGSECIYFHTASQYDLRIFPWDDYGSSGDMCYVATFTVASNTATNNRPDDEPSLEPGSDATEEVVEPTLSAEACIVKEGEGYSWENTEHQITEGARSTHCAYKFTVRNTSDEVQRLIIYTTVRATPDSTPREGWDTQDLQADDPYQRLHTCVTPHGEEGAHTWSYATSLLIVRKIPECSWLTPSDDPKIVEIWEAHAISLENPCK